MESHYLEFEKIICMVGHVSEWCGAYGGSTPQATVVFLGYEEKYMLNGKVCYT